MEKSRNVIKVAELRDIVNAILDHIESQLGIEEVELTEDYYWDVADKSLYISAGKEAEIHVGSLYDDLTFLMPILQDKDRSVSLMLMHVAPLLRYLSIKVGG